MAVEQISDPGRLQGARRREGGSHPARKRGAPGADRVLAEAKSTDDELAALREAFRSHRLLQRRGVDRQLPQRLPVAAKIALPTAGTIAEVPGSPIPPEGSELCTIWTSIAGASLMRSIW